MGTLLLNLGQCGNQVAMSMFNIIERSSMHDGNMYLTRNDQNIYHSIMVDTEPKILKPILEDRKQYGYLDPKNILYYQYGRGNNWGLGYMTSQKKGKKSQNVMRSGANEISMDAYCQENTHLVENIMNQVRKEIEKTDYFLSITQIMSLAGGTGSGLGSRLIESFKDVFEDVTLDCVAILPNRSGETPLQHYNTLLSLAHLQTHADSIIYFENDRIYQMLSQIGCKQIDKSVDLSNVNEYIASCLINLLWINDNHTNDKFYQQMLSEACITPGHKFLEILSAPFMLFKSWNLGPLCSWEDLIKSSYEQFVFEKYDQDEQIIEKITNTKRQDCALSVHSVFRSENVQKTFVDSDSHMKFLERKIQNTFNPVPYNPDAVQLHFINQKCAKKGHDQKMNFTLVNSNKIQPILQNISHIAYQKFKSNAYLDWYWKYGVENSDFEQAFETLEAIQDNYNYMSQY